MSKFQILYSNIILFSKQLIPKSVNIIIKIIALVHCIHFFLKKKGNLQGFAFEINLEQIN